MSASRTTTRVRGLAPWQPRHAAMELLRLVQAVLIEYRHYLLLTVRQVFYRQVGTHGYDKVLNAEREVQASLSPRPATLLGDIGGAS